MDSPVPICFRHGAAKNLACRADFLAHVNGVLNKCVLHSKMQKSKICSTTYKRLQATIHCSFLSFDFLNY